ncbi:Transcriptional regulator, ModE family [Methylocella tundrae]|uniref:Transcriptional regulator, ModE family n=1 Tax=Methylocella tundrae TaxID=227605 RepID=A0A8B6M2Q6_METTU|nr:TOBE domain-containing protein [Methylocella tundrae]VTZ48432.1 Transcriptional regulator, ModE family [Methylocella tundrae]
MPRVLPGEIDTLLALRANGKLLVGRERVTLLEAVIQHGSITKAADVAGFSYKTAWDAVNAINNLLPRPAFITHTGGPRGGGAEVTEEGRRLLVTFRRLEEKLSRISSSIAVQGIECEEDLIFWGIGMKLSARNTFHCTVLEIFAAPVNVEVRLQVSPEVVISALVTNASVSELGLVNHRPVLALVNASSVMLAPCDQMPRISARNKIMGRVLERFDGGSDVEVTVGIGAGKTMTSIMTQDSADATGIKPGADVCAIFQDCNVILASD